VAVRGIHEAYGGFHQDCMNPVQYHRKRSSPSVDPPDADYHT